ncbi:MAG: hypothetical protein IKQ43_01695 [Treponema sp.]|nr:hypothetical protein [Treponema sp.]
MKSFRKYIFAAILFASTACAFSQILTPAQKEKVSEGLTDFANEVMVAAPEAATQMNVWQEAHIGNLYPSIHPHFGGGLSLGGTAINMKGFKAAAEEIGQDFNALSTFWSSLGGGTHDDIEFGSIPDKFFLPTASLDLRIGGFVLPFDFGIFVIMTNPNIFALHLDDPSSIYNMSQAIKFSFLGFDGSIDYFSIGGDFRIRLFEENGFIPMVSVGAGYAYTKGIVKVHTDQENQIGAYTLNTAMDLGFGYQTQVIFIQGQVSKDLSLLHLFAGVRGILSNTTTDWKWSVDSRDETNTISISDSDSGCVTSTGLSELHQDGKWDFSGIQPQIFAGCGFNLTKVQLTLSLCADVRSLFDKGNYTDFIWSGALGIHFKI